MVCSVRANLATILGSGARLAYDLRLGHRYCGESCIPSVYNTESRNAVASNVSISSLAHDGIDVRLRNPTSDSQPVVHENHQLYGKPACQHFILIEV